MKHKTKLFLLSIIFLSAIFLPAFSILSAEDLPIQQIPVTEITLFGPNGILTKALNWFFNIVIILGVIFVIYAGFSYITSSGDPAKTKRALQILMYALIGIAIAVLSIALIKFVTGWFNVDLDVEQAVSGGTSSGGPSVSGGVSGGGGVGVPASGGETWPH
ncbi:MAG: hypothetical protein AB7D02_03090 [Candidatus Paceibacterota bacterium]|nr:hypothetical protein [Candidatus Paceibacterota bacterium]